MLVNSILLNRNVILYTSYVVGEMVVFFIRGMTVSFEILKMFILSCLTVVRDGEGIRNGPFLYILFLLTKTVP